MSSRFRSYCPGLCWGSSGRPAARWSIGQSSNVELSCRFLNPSARSSLGARLGYGRLQLLYPPGLVLVGLILSFAFRSGLVLTSRGISRIVLRVSLRRIRTRAPHLCANPTRSEEHTSELQSLRHLVCRLLL